MTTPSSQPSANLSKIAKNSLIAGGGTFFNYLLSPVVSILTTRVLGAELYGIFSLTQTWGNFLSNISSLGLYGASLRMIPRFLGANDKARIKGSITWTLKIGGTLALTASAVLLFFPTQFCEAFVNRPSSMSEETYALYVAGSFRFYAISILLTSVYLSLLSSLTALQAIPKKVLANEIVGPITKLVTLLILFSLGMDLYAALMSNILQDLAVLITALILLLKVMPELKDPTVKPVVDRKETVKFAGSLFSSQLLNKYTFQLDVFLLGYFGALREVGIYTVALRLQPLIYLPHYTIANIFGPVVGELFAQEKTAEIESLYKAVTKWTFVFSLFIFSTLVLFAEQILGLFGPEFKEAYWMLVIMSVGNLIHDLFGIAATIILMTGKVSVYLLNSGIMAAVNILAFYFLIKSYGIMGAAMGNFLSTATISLLVLAEVYLIYKFHPFQKSLLKPVFAILGAILLCYPLKTYVPLPWYQFTFAAYVLLFAALYGLNIYLLKLDETDRFIVSKIMAKFRKR